MENLALKAFGGTYAGRRILLTGHTGFKGSWLAAWLAHMGAKVTGLALDPVSSPNHWALAGTCHDDRRGDIRDFATVAQAVQACEPEIVFHLAAQTLVRESYEAPLTSWSSNVMGTANVMEACRSAAGLRAIIVATTDKVYCNRGWPWSYRETDTLGGHDPYSASKAAAEFVVDSYRKAFFHQDHAPLVATVRAGNVIGGGDWAAGRLIPDVIRARYAAMPLAIRSPHATRPWQHVLECLSGYLLLGQRLLAGDRNCADAWNFGPASEDTRTVIGVLRAIKAHWPELDWQSDPQDGPHEAALLALDSAKARAQLGWRPVLSLDEGLELTAQWYRRHYEAGSCATGQQIQHYLAAAAERGCNWAAP